MLRKDVSMLYWYIRVRYCKYRQTLTEDYKEVMYKSNYETRMMECFGFLNQRRYLGLPKSIASGYNSSQDHSRVMLPFLATKLPLKWPLTTSSN